jgi:uncharacterized repeat protein (TIGR03803 family)
MKAAPWFLASTMLISAAPFARASTTQIIYSFEGGQDGEYADTDLVMDGAGNLYGTSVQGGAHASGTVWELSPSGDTWTHTVLYSFTGGADGGEPYKGVTLDADGNLYGTAVTGGGGGCEGGCGVAYKLTNNGGTWTQSDIHAFSGGEDGAGPGARLTIGDDGNVYGMAPTGGDFGSGTLYQMHQRHGGTWKLSVMHAFTGGADGCGGSAGALVLRGGKIYGAATACGANGQGTLYELSPGMHGKWRFRTIYTFKGEPDAGFPYGGLMFDGLDNIYGTTYYAGANDVGAVYEVTPRDRGEWKERLLYSFKDGSGDGNSSIANLVTDTSGNLYGTTSAGGTGQGVIFRMAPGAHHAWHESVVHDFGGVPDGAFAYNGMVGDGAGNFYGATTQGGADGEGAIYKFTP